MCGQIPDLTGAKAQGAFPLAKAVNVLVHPGSINLASLLAGPGALAILLVMSWTPWRVVSALVALVVPTVAVVLAGAASVARVGDAGDIPPGILLDHHVVRHVTDLEAIHTLWAPRPCRLSSPAATSPASAPHLVR